MNAKLLYTAPFFMAALVMFVLAGFAWRRRHARGGWILFFICLSASYWALFEGLLYLGFSTESNILITRFQYFGVVPLPPLTLLFVLSVFHMERWISKRLVVFFILMASAILIMAWTNPYHRLYYTFHYTIETGPFPMLGLEHGPLWWVYLVYTYSLVATLTIILLRRVTTSASLYSRQAGVILISVFAVWLVNAIYASGLSPIPNMDISPIAFSLVAASMAWGFFRYYLLDILPVAKDEIFNSLNEPILVLDDKYRVVDLNPAGASLLGLEVTQAIGLDIDLLFSDYPQVIEHIKKSDSAEVSIIKAGRERIYDLRMNNLSDRKKRHIGRLAVWRDISERKWMEQELIRLAKTDPLTGAANRRHLTELATAEFLRARRHGRVLSAVMIDIDHFKDVNDTYGHYVGDGVLKLLVRICLQELRGSDLFGRFGGEEFVAVLIETDMQNAIQVAERLRIEIAGQVLEMSDQRINITVSLGVSEIKTGDTDFQDLLKRADEAMYRAKTAGRNCVHSAGAFC